jgi:hypothetical protein
MEEDTMSIFIYSLEKTPAIYNKQTCLDTHTI